ncbi:serine/threonine protein kinase [Halothece sp. PCC 7418]|uniref:protein kinase domain-containing protein n=1 Tax=Halothece sp. (strain PCC 7418) TaxID=65093 RepID=UPI0002A07A49|nr:serine/threonine protein kinase [Halothece sp. PCC 7418]AFZ42282.1 serine/threonine protein kinase [Halothece sp. PCC 7418]
MDKPKKTVVDELGTAYELTKELGEGGQGKVFAVSGGRYAVKLLPKKSDRETLRRKLQRVRLLPIDDLKMASPKAMLKPPRVGYVMEILTGMTPIQTLINIPVDPELYLAGGGLKRRLLLLAQCAEIFSRLHAKGLVYSDPSPGNIFISSDVDSYEVRLIDADNLHYESDPASGVYTPSYGAPEVVKGKSGVNTLTDAYAFAVIVFQALTLIHPFIGDWVNEGEPELEDKAYQGEVPWIDDPHDTRNQTEAGIPREIVLSPGLRKLSQQCFGEGLNDPLQRPGISQWRDKLYSAAAFTVHCPECAMTYYPNKQRFCPWCDSPQPRFVEVRIIRWEPEKGCCEEKEHIFHRLVLEENYGLTLTTRVIKGRTGEAGTDPLVELVLAGEKIRVRSVEDKNYLLTCEAYGIEKSASINSEKWRAFPIYKNEKYGRWRLHFDALNAPHRVALFIDRS